MASRYQANCGICLALLLSTFFLSFGVYAQRNLKEFQKISGYVRFENRPFAGVNVQVQNTSRGMVTDERGFYEVESKKGETLRFSYVGFRNIEIVIEDVTSILNVDMYEEVNELEEVELKSAKKEEKVKRDIPDELTTAYGKINTRAAGYGVNYVSGEELNLATELLHRALEGKIPNYRVVNNIPIQVVLRGRNSINLDNFAIWDIDGVVYVDNPPLIEISQVKDVYAIQGLAGTVKYGALGGGGVIVVRTKVADVSNFSKGSQRENPSSLNTQLYQNDALPYNQYTEYEPSYLKRFDTLTTAELIYQAYTESGDNLKTDAYYGLAVAQKLYQEFGANTYAKKITETVRDRHADNPEVLKSLAYLLQTDGQYEESLPIYRKLLALRPDYAQSYRDLANSFTETNAYGQAWKTYMQYLNKTGKLTETGIDKVVFDEMQTLFTQKRSLLPPEAVMETADPKEMQQDVRLVFEWSASDAEFEMEFVNPDKQVFVFDHSYKNNNERFTEEKSKGYSSEEFYIDTLDKGQWLVNLTYLGNKKYDPTYLKVTTYYNWGKANQRQEIQTFRLLQTGIKFNLIKVSQTSLASNK